jgi:hypothetical protein
MLLDIVFSVSGRRLRATQPWSLVNPGPLGKAVLAITTGCGVYDGKLAHSRLEFSTGTTAAAD